ncbi:MAG: glycoside hydrolase family 43 protein [Verrucomicrobiales bacterium]|nr:glycoside hydrolase family 43 protein [Verrucomicrobiales bacterium]
MSRHAEKRYGPHSESGGIKGNAFRIFWRNDGPVQREFGGAGAAGVVCAFLLGFIAVTAAAADSASLTFTNPLNPGPDPWMRYHEGNYYLTTTQGNCLRMWKAPTLAGLKTAGGVEVWRDDNPTRSHGIWAPEFHFITNRWYLYYTAMAASRVDTTHRMHVLESEGIDPLGPYHYKGRLFDPANDFYAIDGSVFQHPGDGRWYFLWAAHPGHRIRIARMSNPWTLEGSSVQLEASGFGCEEVREGPVVLHRNGRLFLTYSACDTGKPDYKLGMLIASENADVMVPGSWMQHPQPIFERNDAAGVFGPGHHGFFRSPDGTEDWIVYHAKTTSRYTYAGRTTRAQKFTWNPDGTPNLGKPLPLETVLQEPSGTANTP